MINAAGNSVATRIAALPARGEPMDVAAVYQEMSAKWPADLGPLLLDIGEFGIEEPLLKATPNHQVHLEIPSAVTQTKQEHEWIAALHHQGFQLVLRGIPARELPDPLVEAFSYATIDVTQDRRIAKDFTANPAALSKRRIDTIITGITTIDEMERCFASGAGAIAGWPTEDVISREPSSMKQSNFSTISRLIMLINQDADPRDMEKILASDPSLAFRLFRYLNSPTFGLRTEIQSFEHAMMMLGREPLKKWLALLLATATNEQCMKPLIYASVRRGFLLEKILSTDADPDTRESAFILGVFSMLDKLFGQPFEKLFEQVIVPDPVFDALVHNTGAVVPYLNLARAIESSPAQVHVARENAFVSGTHCNNSLFDALHEASAVNTA
jgi:EAL and modified HD-GYP domain-containing signal transduction protein